MNSWLQGKVIKTTRVKCTEYSESLNLRNVCWCGYRGGKGTDQRRIPGKGKEEVKYISDGQGMKLGQCVSAISNLSFLECTESKGVAGADVGIIGSSQMRKTLAHKVKQHSLCSLGQELIRDSSGGLVCAVREVAPAKSIMLFA